MSDEKASRQEAIAAEKELMIIGRERVEGEKKRKTDPTDELFGMLHRARRMGFSWSEVAAVCGVSPTVMERWRREWPDKFEQLDAVVSTSVIEVAEALLKSAKGYEVEVTDFKGNKRMEHVKADPRAQIFLLKSRGGWSDDPRHANKDDPDDPKDLENMSDNQLLTNLTHSVDRLNQALESHRNEALSANPVIDVVPVPVPVERDGDDGDDGDEFEVEI